MNREIVVDPEFQKLLMPLTPEEYAQLERNILDEGCREPLLVWLAEPEKDNHKCYYDPAIHGDGYGYGDGPCNLETGDGVWTCRACDHNPALLEGTLIDGHNRYEICAKHGVEFEVEYLDFDIRKEAHDWIINNQLGRRNVTPEQASYLRGKRFNSEKKAHGGDRKSSYQNDTLIGEEQRTNERLAEEYHVSPATISRDAKFAEAVDTIAGNAGEEARRAILSGEANLSKQDVVFVSSLDPEKQREVIEQRTKPHVAHNSGNNEWYTPVEYIQAARHVLGKIDLDPATSPTANGIVDAFVFYTAEDDGLTKDWQGRVWMNPPYAGELIGKFISKLCQHFRDGEVVEAIVLVNNATETGWFQETAALASAICFPKGRVKFWHPERESAPLQGQALLYLGTRPRAFSVAFADFGFTATLD